MTGLIVQLIGIWVLRYAQTHRKNAVAVGGWGLLLASTWVMGVALGAELGVVWSLTTISVAAYILILNPFFTAKIIGHNRVPRNGRRMPAAPSGSKRRLTLRLLSAGPLYLIAALGLSLLIATKPWTTELTRLFVGGLSSPFFWSVGALHATVDPNLWRIFWMPIFLSLASFGIFYLS
ncbi:hypothetical protein [Parasphingorhabdus cellanae]|uniref:Uncharacterized protein n=1 Tax=Parasphingorhabdus cellanae TaxID=2806553 RepID=A0ABX7T314_9SPHN|nr:hypothetical protein [Parasphingorhabdus cellanae]QTD54462.1 hypothetical protein J4G78_09130 [Parasphingorhabdus cellanae]